MIPVDYRFCGQYGPCGLPAAVASTTRTASATGSTAATRPSVAILHGRERLRGSTVADGVLLACCHALGGEDDVAATIVVGQGEGGKYGAVLADGECAVRRDVARIGDVALG